MVENNEAQPFWGEAAKEEFHFFLFDKNSPMPVIIENIGITTPNPKYRISRGKDSDYFVFEYVISGKGYLEINGEKFTLEKGDVYCVEPGYNHTYYSDPANPLEKIWINFFSDIFVQVFKAYGISGKFVFKNCNCLQHFYELKRLASTSNYSDEICYKVSSILFQILCILAESVQEKPHISQTGRDIKKYLDNALFSNITIKQIAERLHLSTTQINREFYKYYRQNPYTYLLNNKINMAKRLLVSSDLNINEISDKLGFNDPHYFSRIFKKKVGISPTDYKKFKAK